MATIKDVAKAAGVSLSTASYALNGSSKISEATRNKVLEVARRLNYQKNGLATDLKRSSTKTIALILSDMSGPYYTELIRGVQETALENGYDLIACSSFGGNESTAIKFLREKRVDGVIISAHNLQDEPILQSARPSFPIVVLDRYLQSEHIYNVLVDNERGGYLATEHLIQNGCKRIAHISNTSNSYDHKLRYKGYMQALRDYNLESPSNLNINGKFTIDGGYTATKLLIAQSNLPDAIFYGNDEMAIGGVKAFKEAGIRVPEDISIIGFDDIYLVEHMNPPLTTIRQPKYEAGSLAAHLILQLLDGRTLDREYRLPIELITRKSVNLRGENTV